MTTNLRRPRVLDLCCCAGGAGVGYHRAGFDVVGVDIVDRPSYPLPFVQADALAVLRGEVPEVDPDDFDLIHFSPPCQGYGGPAQGTNAKRPATALHPRLIEPGRGLLDARDVPYVIENVPGAPIRHDLKLWGPDFDLGVLQPRFFELGRWSTPQPPNAPKRGRVRGWRHGQYFDGPYVAVYGRGGGKATVAEAQAAKGIDWTGDWVELCEAIPPAYTEWIGRRWIQSAWIAPEEPMRSAVSVGTIGTRDEADALS